MPCLMSFIAEIMADHETMLFFYPPPKIESYSNQCCSKDQSKLRQNINVLLYLDSRTRKSVLNKLY